jgi:hypothetical protein
VLGELVYVARRGARQSTTVTAKSKVTMVEIRASALRAAACQNAFNKVVARFLVERLAQTNKLLAQAIRR